MNWTEITVSVPLEYTDTAAAIANMTVPYGIYIEDYSDLEQGAEEIAHIDLIDEELRLSLVGSEMCIRDRMRSLLKGTGRNQSFIFIFPSAIMPRKALLF